MNAKIKQNTDVINFEIEKTKFRLGNSDKVIEIDTGDLNFVTRFTDAQSKISAYLETLNINTGSTEKDVEALKQADLFMKEQINYIFDYDVSSAVFGNASCMSVTKKGEYYFENFIGAILPVIEHEFGVRIDKMSTRAKQYMQMKGKFSK